MKLPNFYYANYAQALQGEWKEVGVDEACGGDKTSFVIIDECANVPHEINHFNPHTMAQEIFQGGEDVLANLHRAKLSEVDKALMKLGVVDEHGRLTNAGFPVVVEFLFGQDCFKEDLATYLEPLWKKGKKGDKKGGDNKESEGEMTAS